MSKRVMSPKWEDFLALKERIEQGVTPDHKRKGFSQKTRKAVWEAQNGYCEACGEFMDGRFDVDHVVEHVLTGDDDLGNLVALHEGCHQAKTSERAPELAKTRRLRKDHTEGRQIDGRLKGRGFEKPKFKRAWPSRPFARKPA